MVQLSPAKQAAVRGLVAQAPEAVLALLLKAFRGAPGEGPRFVVETTRAEQLARAGRALAFQPLAPLFAAKSALGVRFDPVVAVRLWTEISLRRPRVIDQLNAALKDETLGQAPPDALLDGLCAEAAALLREGDPSRLGLSGVEEAEALATLFDLAPLARRATARLDGWLTRLDSDRLAEMKLIFKDARAVSEDATPLLLEILLAHMAEPHLVLRLLAAVGQADRESFLVGSELRTFGERLLEDVEARLAEAARLDVVDAASARGLADTLAQVAVTLDELVHSIRLESDGAWGRRQAEARTAAVALLEGRYGRVEATLNRALPTVRHTLAGRMSRQVPNVEVAIDSAEIKAALALLTLVRDTRKVADLLGCGAARAQAVQAAGLRVDQHAEGLLDLVNAAETDHPQAALALADVCAELLALARDPDAGRVVRRRVAAAREALTQGALSRAAG